MNDLDAPDTRPGYCPECGQPATIWHDMKRLWECNYCNWTGRFTNQEKKEWSI